MQENLPLLERHAPMAYGADPNMFRTHRDEGHEAQLEPLARLHADGRSLREGKLRHPEVGVAEAAG